MRIWSRAYAVFQLTAVIALVLSSLQIASAVYAQEISIRFTGEVTLVNDLMCQCLVDVEVGSPLSGYYVYDLNTPDSDPSPNIGTYLYSSTPYGFVAWVGQHEFRSDTNSVGFYIVLHDSIIDAWGLHDLYYVRENNVIEKFYLPTYFFDLYLRDYTASALSSDSLPSEAPILDDWPSRTQIHIAGQDFDIWADILFMSEGVPSGAYLKKRYQLPGLNLLPNIPNPFMNGTQIRFELSSTSDVTIDVYDVTGRRVFYTLLPDMPLGLSNYFFIGKDQNGQFLPSGVYLIRVNTMAGHTAAQKLVLIR